MRSFVECGVAIFVFFFSPWASLSVNVRRKLFVAEEKSKGRTGEIEREPVCVWEKGQV